jgi:hypothetical protein
VLDPEWVLANATENQGGIDHLSLSCRFAFFGFGLKIVLYQLPTSEKIEIST